MSNFIMSMVTKLEVENKELRKKIINLEKKIKELGTMKDNFEFVFSTVERVHLKLGLENGDWKERVKAVRKWSGGSNF